MLTDTDAARQIAQRIQAQDASLWEKIVQWFKDFEQKLRSAYNGLKPGSGIAKDAKKTLQQVDGLVKMWADMAVDSAENYSKSDLGFEGGDSTSIKLCQRETYPYNMATVIQDYLKNVDTDILNYAETCRLNKGASYKRLSISPVSNAQVSDAGRLLNMDFSDFTNAIERSAINHIEKRHGRNGKSDSSMQDLNDLARIGYVLGNYDDVKITTDADGNESLSKQFRDKNNNPAPMLKYEKKINGTYYVVVACPDSKYKKLWVVSAYISKNKDSQVTQEFDEKTPNSTPEASLASPTAVTDNLAQPQHIVKQNLSEKATIYVQNKNELEGVGATNNLRGLAANIKFNEDMVAQDGDSVRRSSRKAETEQSHKSDASNPYSYESLTAKPDMAVTTLPEDVPKSRADVVYQAKQNAAKIGKFNTKDGSVSVYVKDIGKDVVLGTPGLKHSLDRRLGVNAPVVLKAGEIIENSIRINEMTAQKPEASESYVLIGAARNNSGELHVVRSVVNRFSNELSDMDILYAINAKKEPAALLPRVYGEKSAPSTDSTISIAELLDNVNEYFPDILPEDVLRHFGHESRPEGKLGESALYSSRKAETEESHKEELAKTRARLSKEAQERRENILRDYQKSRKISVENWRMTELGILKSAAENIASLDLSEREKKGLENFSGHLKKLEGIQGEIDAIRSKEGELSQQDLKKLTSLEQQADSMRKLLWEFSEYDVLKKVSQKTRKLLMDKYGSIKPGENPSRQADIPIQTNDLNRVSQTVRTAVEASATSDEMAEKIRQKVVEGEFSYLPITDDDSNKRAEETINRKGWDDALDDWIRIWTRKMLR